MRTSVFVFLLTVIGFFGTQGLSAQGQGIVSMHACIIYGA